MVGIHYRWDFIGLSTDTKPTPATSEKVVNGSTFYCSDNSKLYVFCDGTWYERKPLGGGGGGGSYVAGTGIDITDDTISVDTTTIQPKLTAGSNVTISDNTISATDTTYSNFTGTDGTAAGVAGLVPAPATTDAGKFLKADGTWDAAGSTINVVQTTGTSTTDVMSQNAVTDMVYSNNNKTRIRIGTDATVSSSYPSIAIGQQAIANRQFSIAIGCNNAGDGPQATSAKTIAVGYNAVASVSNGVAIGADAVASGIGAIALGGSATALSSIALGGGSSATMQGEMNIGINPSWNEGYNNSAYRLLTGLYDPQSDHDAATKGYVDPTTDSSSPTTATVGRLGQIQIDTTNADAYMCVAVDSVTPSYTWKKINA